MKMDKIVKGASKVCDTLEFGFKNLASSSQILESPAPPGTKASLSTLDYYMFGALGEVVSLAVVTTSSTTRRSMESLQAWDNGQIG